MSSLTHFFLSKIIFNFSCPRCTNLNGRGEGVGRCSGFGKDGQQTKPHPQTGRGARLVGFGGLGQVRSLAQYCASALVQGVELRDQLSTLQVHIAQNLL